MQKITPFIWFKEGAKEAAEFYVSVFGEGSRIKKEQIMTDTPSGTVEIIDLELRGFGLILMAAGPFREINEAISFVIDCEDQAEVDYFWERLSAVPEAEQCGWVKDRYGVSWQIVPKRLNELLADPDKEKAGRVTQAMLQMKKIDIAALEAAAGG